jgi:hypothetical protein
MRYRQLLLAIWITNVGFSQPGKPVFLSLDTKGGFIFAHRPFMSHLVRENSLGFEATIFRQQTGSDQQTLRLGYPLKGLALEFRDFGYDAVLGKAFGMTGFMVFPIWQSKKNLCFDIMAGTGLGYITKHYNKLENPTNNAIGSGLNAKVNVKFSLTKFTAALNFGGGVEFAHYSNGGLKMPNLGLNSPSIFFRAGYNFGERVIPSYQSGDKTVKQEFPRKLTAEFIFTGKELAAGSTAPQLYPVVAGRLAYTHSNSGLWGAEIALDIIHNEANFHRYTDSTFTRNDILQMGVYAGTYIQFYNAQLAFGLGWYIRDVINPEGVLYNRVGYRYYFCEKWFGVFNVKANYGKADYFEFGIGRRFLKW